MAVWSELWNSILQARLDQMGWNLKWFIFELFLTEIVNDFLIKTANFKMWFYAVSKMLHLTLTLCLSLASQQMAFFPICILPCLWPCDGLLLSVFVCFGPRPWQPRIKGHEYKRRRRRPQGHHGLSPPISWPPTGNDLPSLTPYASWNGLVQRK